MWDDIGGISNIKIKSPTSIYGQYLTYCLITSDETISSSASWTEVNNNVVRVSKWKFNTSVWTPQIPYWIVRIPEAWVYMINVDYSLSSWSYTNNPLWFRIQDNGGKKRTEYKVSLNWSYDEVHRHTIVDNFTEWDELAFEITQQSWTSRTWMIKAFIIKLSE